MSAPAWLEDGERMRARGFTYAEIAKAVGRSQANVCSWLNPVVRERKLAEGRARQKAFTGVRPHKIKAEPKPEKAVKRRVSQDEKMGACRAFAAGKITRAELMRRITPP